MGTNAVNRLPLVSILLEQVGLVVTTPFAHRYLIVGPDRCISETSQMKGVARPGGCTAPFAATAPDVVMPAFCSNIPLAEQSSEHCQRPG